MRKQGTVFDSIQSKAFYIYSILLELFEMGVRNNYQMGAEMKNKKTQFKRVLQVTSLDGLDK